MSVRVYRGKHRELGGPSRGLRLVPWLNVLALFVSSVLWLFISEDRRDSLTVFILIFLFSTAVFHALIWHGFSWALTFGIIAYGISFSALALNTANGFLFGDIEYTYRLGNQLFSVPSILPLFWVAISYFAFTLARRISYSLPVVIFLGALFANSAKLGLDEIAIKAGYWRWVNLPAAERIFLDLPLKAIVVSILVFALIIFMASQLPRNDKLSSRPPFFAYLTFTFFTVIATFIYFDEMRNAIWIFLYMGILSLIYTFKALRDY